MHILGQIINRGFNFRVDRMRRGIIGVAQRDDTKFKSTQFKRPDFLGDESFR